MLESLNPHTTLCINHVFYADDLCLMAPGAIALQELINLCYDYSIEIDNDNDNDNE